MIRQSLYITVVPLRPHNQEDVELWWSEGRTVCVIHGTQLVPWVHQTSEDRGYTRGEGGVWFVWVWFTVNNRVKEGLETVWDNVWTVNE